MKNILGRLIEIAIVVAMMALIVMNFRLRRDLQQAHAEMRGLAKALEAAEGEKRYFRPGDTIDTKDLVPCATCRSVAATWPSGRKIVVILNPSCPSCTETVAGLKSMLPTLSLPYVIVSTDDDSSTENLVRRYELQGAVLRITRRAPQYMKYAKSPQVVLVNGMAVTARCQSVAQCAAIARQASS